MHYQVLSLDLQGNPREWLKLKKAANAYARGIVSYDFGDELATFSGGVSRIDGKRSLLILKSMIVVDGESDFGRFQHAPVLTAESLFARDLHICAYCGKHTRDLEMEHIIPRSRGGRNTWMNLVSACHACNQKKSDRTPEESRMKLLYLPYVPNYYEHLILTGRNVKADQMEFLMARVPKNSRLLIRKIL